MITGPVEIASKLGKVAYRSLGSKYVKNMLESKGAQFDGLVTAYGRPIVTMAENSSISIGKNVVLCSNPRYTALGVSRPVVLRTLAAESTIKIGDDTGLSGTVICAAISVNIGARCLVGADVTITDTDFHPVSPSADRRWAAIPLASEADMVSIGDDVFIGTGAVILKGVTIGHGSVIGARSVVSSDIPPMTIYAGTPAREIGKVASL